MGAASYYLGDTRQVLARLADEGVQVDLVLTSPPFLALRSYLPDGDPAKVHEIGSERTPGAFLDVLLDVVEACGRILAPHGSIAVELGDTYAGSGGAGGDYGEGGLRDGQQRFDGSSRRGRAYVDGVRQVPSLRGKPEPNGEGWPLPKSLCLIPETFAWALAYGRNPWTGRTLDPWRVRNFAPWIRPNPPVGDLGDKFRPATSYFTIATRARNRWFDLDAVRYPPGDGQRNSTPDMANAGVAKWGTRKNTGFRGWHNDEVTAERTLSHPAGAPPLDWTDTVEVVLDELLRHARNDNTPITGKLLSAGLRDSGVLDWGDAWWQPTEPYKGAHYATWPRQLCVRPILSMCPERVCTTCGEPSRRITGEVSYVGKDGKPKDVVNPIVAVRGASGGSSVAGTTTGTNDSRRVVETLGFTDCGHGTWRPGIVLDPFAGSGTTLLVATGHGRDAIGIDLDHRNADLARERIGMFLDVIDVRL